jgi:hypothetical protein
MLSNVHIEVKIVLQGGAALCEHPAPHEQAEYASVWRTPLQNLLCAAAPDAKQIHIQQWKFGASSTKPTVIRAMGIPQAAGVLHRHEVPGCVKPVKVLAGIDDSGTFRTAQAKEYPTELCKALVATLLDGLARRRTRSGQVVRHVNQLKEQEWQWLQQVIQRSNAQYADHFLPDYQPY